MDEHTQSGNAGEQEGTDRRSDEEKSSVQGYIAIKGTRNGLLLTLEPGTPFSDLLKALSERLAESPSFFRGASLAVDTSQRTLRVSERIQLEKLLARYQMSIASPALAQEREKAPAETRPITSPLEEYGRETKEIAESERRDPRIFDDTLYLRRTVRSGQAIHHHSNVVILGDVNPGAEIIAGGDIVVWGVLRGMVHAGYPDNDQAIVCSLQLAPVQLRIAHLLSRPPEGFEAQARPEVASIRQGQIVVETWVSGRAPRR
ncbi:MAG: septum site-determining protein MinC [Ktedonobacteraceae bacterium]|nr:septum site-determining protein MinC [Ktedonobacteraceae bacterium]